jgi:hypothetical protein
VASIPATAIRGPIVKPLPGDDDPGVTDTTRKRTLPSFGDFSKKIVAGADCGNHSALQTDETTHEPRDDLSVYLAG